MNKSESIKELATALAKAQGDFANVKKDANNPFFKSKYADLASNVETARPVLKKYGLALSQLPGFDIQQQAIVLTTILMHESGEFISQDLPMPVMDMKAQSIGSALTYARRYAMQSVLGLAAEDDDGNAASGNHEGHEQTFQPRQSKPPASAKTITEPQQKRFFAIASKSGASESDIKKLIKKAGFENSKDITMGDKYDKLCALFESGRWAEELGDPTFISAGEAS